jgi:hypothetical protein
MARLLCIFSLLLFSAFSCSKDKEETADPLEKFPAPVLRVEAPAAATIGETVTLDVYFVVNNGCGEFGSFDVAITGNQQTIKVFPKYREGICTMDLPTRQAAYTFKPGANGTYTFRFWSGLEDEFITKTIVVAQPK